MDRLLEELQKEAENGNWEKANGAYNRAMEEMQKSNKRGGKLITKNEKKLSDLKNLLTSLNPNKQNFDFSSNALGTEKKEATCSITNSTNYTLTLYYSGVANKIIILSPNETKDFNLPKGLYNVTAKVDNPRVREYFGVENFKGYKYPIEFYIGKSGS